MNNNKWYMSKMSGDTAVIPWALVILGGIFLITGIVMFSHHSAVNTECHSTLGQFGQDFSGYVQHKCSQASHDTAIGGFLAAIGVIALAVGARTVMLSRDLIAKTKVSLG